MRRADTLHPPLLQREDKRGGMWEEAGKSRKVLEQTLSDSEQPFSLKRQEINQPDCVGLGWGGGAVSPGM